MIDDDEKLIFPLDYPEDLSMILEIQEYCEEEIKKAFGITSDMLGSRGPKLFEEE